MNVIDKINAKYVKNDVPEFRVGDTVRVDVKIIEGKRERIQAFEGVVVARRGGSVSETFTVRKMSSGVGVEITTLRPSIYMTFPMDKPSKGQSIQAVENAVRKIIYECMLDLNLFDLTMQIELEPELYFGGIQVKKVKELLKSSFMDIFANFSNDVVEIDSSKVLRSYKYGKHGYFLSVEFTCYPNSGFDKLIKNIFSIISDIIKFTFHGFFHPLPF